MSKATRRFIVNKVLEMLITLVVVTLISFLLVRLSPIDPAEAYARRSFAAFSFTDEQMEWLRLIKDHIAVSLSIEPEDLDLSPFDRKGGLGRFYDVFGDQYEAILQEMNVELVA